MRGAQARLRSHRYLIVAHLARWQIDEIRHSREFGNPPAARTFRSHVDVREHIFALIDSAVRGVIDCVCDAGSPAHIRRVLRPSDDPALLIDTARCVDKADVLALT